jgi:hypothetical protein
MSDKEFTGTKFELVLNMLKQPSTIKGILGMLTVISMRLGLTVNFTAEDWQAVVEGIAVIYFGISIFWQKS